MTLIFFRSNSQRLSRQTERAKAPGVTDGVTIPSPRRNAHPRPRLLECDVSYAQSTPPPGHERKRAAEAAPYQTVLSISARNRLLLDAHDFQIEQGRAGDVNGPRKCLPFPADQYGRGPTLFLSAIEHLKRATVFIAFGGELIIDRLHHIGGLSVFEKDLERTALVTLAAAPRPLPCHAIPRFTEHRPVREAAKTRSPLSILPM
jgi:hypothetical protein